MNKNNTCLPLQINGHCKIVDDLGITLVDQSNAIHPQNMARIIARALAHEPHSSIYRIAFGNGGTSVDAAFNITYNSANDGLSPDIASWNSRIYKETYSEIIDDSNSNIGVDPGSADMNTGVRAGGGSVPSSDPIHIEHVSGPGVRSNELGLFSEVVISCTINGNEPTGQFLSDAGVPSLNTDFVFDEIGLYTEGSSSINTSGYQQLKFGNTSKISTDATGLLPGTNYTFDIIIDGGTPQIIGFTTPVSGGSGANNEILFGDVCQALNTNNTAWNITPGSPSATFIITDLTAGTFPSITGKQTFGMLQIQSHTSGISSSINLSGPNTTTFLNVLNPPLGSELRPPVNGTVAGQQNSPTDPSTQRERLLTHLIFAPVLKSKNRTLSVTYTLTISVARSN